MDKMDDKYIGKKLDGRYKILELTGMGGMANVYKAEDVLEERIVAVKILRDEFNLNEEFVRRFKNESKAIALLSHPNIVKVYDVSFSDKIHYIVMEYIDGITLKEYIDQQKALSWKEAVHFTVQILRALQHAHEKGIVHRDIKPQNIMLLPDGTIKVMDFGIARFARNDSKTMTDKAIGSVHYIAPEQARGDTTDQKADIYSVGVILFEMLTGQLPFVADSAVTVAIKQISAEPKKPRELNPEIPEGLEQITMKAMQKDVNQRYQSAAEMLADIDEFKKDPSIHFAYKYFVDDAPTKYVDAIHQVKEEELEEKGKKTPSVAILAGVAAAFVVFTIVFVLGMVFFGDLFKKVPTIEMPDLKGQKYEDVINDDQYKKFQFQEKKEEYSEEFEAGQIIKSDPEAGKKVKENAKVTLTVSKGPETVVIPSIVNMELSAAQQKLIDAGVDWTVERKADDKVTTGFVISVDPGVGTTIPADQKVTVYVSTGKEVQQKNIPNVVNTRLEDARRAIEIAGFKVGSVKEEESDKAAGIVIAQDPSSGTAEEGTTINLTVSKGRSEKEVSISIQLPEKVTDTVTVQVLLGNTQVYSQQLQPSVARSIDVKVKGTGTAEVTVNINGSVYRTYSIDFSSGKSTLLTDKRDQMNKDAEDKNNSSKPEEN